MNRLSGRLAIAVLILACWGAISYASYKTWLHGAVHRDFYPRWAGVRLLLRGSHDLYSEDATRAIQVMAYGAPIPPDRDQQGFAYPAPLAVLLLPFGLIQDVEVATALWQGLSSLLVLGSLVLLRKFRGAPLWLPLVLLVWQYPLLMLFQGQFTAIPLAAISIALVGFVRGDLFVSGVALSFAFVKPEIAAGPAATLAAISLTQRRTSWILGLLCGGLVLFTASIVLAGWWVPPWLAAVDRYASYAKFVWPLAEAWHVTPLLACAMVGVGAIAFFLVREDSMLLVAVSVPISLLWLPQTLNWGLTMLLLPLMLSWSGRARIVVVLAWVIGWSFIFVPNVPYLWKAQAIAMPLLSLVAILLTRFGRPASRSDKAPGSLL